MMLVRRVHVRALQRSRWATEKEQQLLTDSNRMLKQRKQPQSGTSNYCQLHPADVLLHRPEALSASCARRGRFSCRCQSPLSVEFTIYSLAFNWTARLVELGVKCTS